MTRSRQPPTAAAAAVVLTTAGLLLPATRAFTSSRSRSSTQIQGMAAAFPIAPAGATDPATAAGTRNPRTLLGAAAQADHNSDNDNNGGGGDADEEANNSDKIDGSRKVVHGDLLQLAHHGGEFDVIVHGCNCLCAMGAGIAKQVRDQCPEAYAADKATVKGDRSKLGTYTSAIIHGDNQHQYTVVNAYTQYHFKGPRTVLADYDAIRRVFAQIKTDFTGQRIAYPKIGAGLAGGDWNRISSIIDAELQGEDHTLVVYKRG